MAQSRLQRPCAIILNMNAHILGTDERFYMIDIGRSYSTIIDDIEKITIIKALERSLGNQIAASKVLGLHRNTLRNKIKKFGIDVGRFKR